MSTDAFAFRTHRAFDRWLRANHDQQNEVWLKLAKRDAPAQTISYDEAVEVALCFGWIDGQKARGDDGYGLQRFTPRSARSRWSRINRDKAERLLAEGRMHPAGRAEMDRARSDGRWAAAYESQSSVSIPDDLRRELAADPVVAAAFADLDARNRFSIIWRLNDAKRPETRARRLAKYVEMLRRGETIHG